MDNKFTFSVVPAKLKDLGALQRLEKECFAQDAWTILDLIGVLTLPDTIRLKAVAGDEMIGFVAGDIRRNEKVGWITTIAVSPKYRQQGVGMALLSICEDQLPFPNIRLSVRRSNLSAIRLYQRFGYVPVDVWQKYYSGGEDALVYEKVKAV